MRRLIFAPHTKLSCFSDGSGVAIYSSYTGDTLMLHSELRDAVMLQSFSALPDFNLTDMQNSLGIDAEEADRVIQYLLDNQLIISAAGC
ncbi:hypothetical protein [Rheinheimera sp.]|uniref:hypothetical protein n=1 Tax=Rheinheimera sp. TaxID=1869214 RepID=UPI0027331590|nr:hypothetical protein [Rheinheimera sp.]MDP2716253.1 hypothetical protein [Rheinheimera sp.]